MRQFLSKYKILVCIVLWTFCTQNTFAVSDTIVTIKQLQFKTERAIEKQRYFKAIDYLNTASKLTLLPKYWRFQSDVDFTKAKLYYDLQFYQKAQSEAKKAIENSKEENNIIKLAQAYNLYAIILASNGNYAQSESYLNKADSIFIENKSIEDLANIDYGRGILNFKQLNYPEAVKYFKKAIEKYQEQGLDYMETESYSQLSHVLSLAPIDQIENSLEQAEKSVAILIRLANEYDFPRFIIESHKIKQHINILKNDFPEAEKERIIYMRLRDSIRQVHLVAIEDAVQGESAIGDLNKIIASQKDDIHRKEKSLFFGKLTGWLSIALIIILSLLTLSLYKNNNLRTKANELLQDKNTELQQAKENAEKASQAKAQFLSTISHELRTPMYTVTGLTHLLLEEDPKPEQKDHLKSLKISGEYLLSLINNLLDLNKLEVNKVELEHLPFDLRSRLESVLSTLSKSAELNNNKIHFEYDENIPQRVIGDSLKLSQIIVNLVSNSIKFTIDGDIWVRVQKLQHIGNEVILHFEVQDTGDGVSKKKQTSIFESFSQGSLQINRKYGGTGLGLSIVKNLLNLMGSTISLESKLGKGSKFSFDIKYETLQDEELKTEIVPQIHKMDERIFENKKVLIVEDNKINQMITKKILEKKKMICSVVDNGMDAVNLAQSGEFDVILMDIHMPGISGIEATEKIREFNTEVVIIALTALTIEENLEEFYNAGFNEFISKPFNASDFFEKIYRTLRGNSMTI